jgi:hypothetical protein
MEKEIFDRRATITGHLIQHDGDHFNGNEIEISTSDESHIVELGYEGEDLLYFLDKAVKAMGFINRYIDGSYRIIIDNYEVLSEE